KELGLEICRWKDPEIQVCMRRAVESALPKLKNGVPRAGIPKLEPLEVSEMAIDFGNTGPVNLKVKLNDVKIYGTTSTKIPELKYVHNFNLNDLADVVSKLKLHFKEVTRKGVKYWNLENMEYDVAKVGGMKLKMGGDSTKGKKPLEISLDQAFSESAKELEGIMKPVMMEAIRRHYMLLAQRFLQKIPLSELFPDK
ncbi:unnamed protein product, partial [Nesidiocoris tenuis]